MIQDLPAFHLNLPVKITSQRMSTKRRRHPTSNASQAAEQEDNEVPETHVDSEDDDATVNPLPVSEEANAQLRISGRSRKRVKLPNGVELADPKDW